MLPPSGLAWAVMANANAHKDNAIFHNKIHFPGKSQVQLPVAKKKVESIRPLKLCRNAFMGARPYSCNCYGIHCSINWGGIYEWLDYYFASSSSITLEYFTTDDVVAAGIH